MFTTKLPLVYVADFSVTLPHAVDPEQIVEANPTRRTFWATDMIRPHDHLLGGVVRPSTLLEIGFL
jgi:hypothetical protein